MCMIRCQEKPNLDAGGGLLNWWDFCEWQFGLSLTRKIGRFNCAEQIYGGGKKVLSVLVVVVI